MVRTLAQRLLRDAKYFAAVRNTDFTIVDIVARATYLSNILYGSKTLSSYELVRGYTPSICGLPQCPVKEELGVAHKEQQARRALKLLEKGRAPRTVASSALKRDDKVYYFKRGVKFGTWELGFVRGVDEHLVTISSSANHRGKPIRAAVEDIRKVPTSSLLREVDEIDFIFPRSYAVVDEEELDAERFDSYPMAPIFPELEGIDRPPDSQPEATGLETPKIVRDDPPPSVPDDVDIGISRDLPSTSDVLDMFEEERSLWSSHPTTAALLAHQRPRRLNQPVLDIGNALVRKISSLSATVSSDLTKTRARPEPQKDIGSIPVRAPPMLPHVLQSSEQLILQEIKAVIADKTASEAKLQFVPDWVLKKAMDAERQQYLETVKEVDIRSLPRFANIISSHHFFQVKHDGKVDTLKLKCRLVPHGNRDKEKEFIRSDSATAQFPVIRTVLSTAAILRLSLATIDIKGAYLQGEHLTRDIYMRPPRGWASTPRMVWKLLKPAYGLVESGRLWQLVVEEWMSNQGVTEVHGLQQLFVKRNEDGRIVLVMAKVVDDFLISGDREAITAFHGQMSTRFTVGRFIQEPDLVFNRLHIHQNPSFDVHVSMQEYMQTIQPIVVPHHRKKNMENNRCSQTELTAFLGLTGSLNYLGHGALPQASFAASHLQQLVGRLTVRDLVTANKVLAELQQLSPTLTYLSPEELADPCYLAFSDASQGKTPYGQTGYVSGIHLPAGGASVFHVLDWLSKKQSRVSFSSIGAEILAAATSADRGSLIAEQLQVVHDSQEKLPFILTVDSHGLFSTITTLHEGSDYRLRPTVARMRDSYETGEISMLQWIPGVQNLADALTKRNVVMYRMLNDVMKNGILNEEITASAQRSRYGRTRKKVTFQV